MGAPIGAIGATILLWSSLPWSDIDVGKTLDARDMLRKIGTGGGNLKSEEGACEL